MGFLDELKRLARPYEDEEDDDGFDDFDSTGATGRMDRSDRSDRMDRTDRTADKPAPRQQDLTPRSDVDARRVDRRNNKVVNINTTTQLQVVLVKPDRFENAAEIADHLREKRTVVLNMESTKKEISNRVLDFLSGVTYAQQGKIKRVANSTYIITPYNVDILGDLLDELENNGLYF